MEDYITLSAKTLDDAITEALVQLGVTSDRLDYIVVEKGSEGFLGIGRKQAVIKARRKQEEKPVEEVVKEEPKVEEPKVEEPQIPVTPAVTSAKSLKASTVKTGDVANITGIILILILFCTVIVLCGTMNAWRKAKKHHKKH